MMESSNFFNWHSFIIPSSHNSSLKQSLLCQKSLWGLLIPLTSNEAISTYYILLLCSSNWDSFYIYFSIFLKYILCYNNTLLKSNDWINLYKLELNHLLDVTFQLLKYIGVEENKWFFLSYPIIIIIFG